MSEHHRRLEAMYLRAPCNAYFTNLTAQISEGVAVIGFDVRPDMHHAAGALHGAHYFKPLDDAAFFAANSLAPDVFVLTAELTVQFFRPVLSGRLTAHGKVTKSGKSLIFAESVLRDDKDKEVARATGCFAMSQIELNSIDNYRLALPR